MATISSNALRLLSLIAFSAATAYAQSNADIQLILTRLEKLEAENRALAAEVRALRRELSPAPAAAAAPGAASEPLVEERLEIHERRIEEHQQTKIETSQRYPLRFTGMAVFNAFTNSKGAGGADNPTTASLTDQSSGGGTLRQSVLGIQFESPRSFLGGKVQGHFYADFFGGTNAPLNHSPRLRVAAISVDWKTRSLMAGQEKPLISPRDPNSLSQIGVSPLTNAGNLWLWLPQVRVEQRFTLDESMLFKAQLALFQTNETSANVPAAFAPSLEARRPALQGRFEFSHEFSGGRRFAIAPGFHTSVTHVAGTSVPSRLVSFDWLMKPVSRFEFTGFFFAGANVANMGAVRQGFTVLGFRNVIAVRSRGGWAQGTFLATDRLTFNAYAGQIDDNNSDLRFSGIAKNFSYAGNAMYRIAPNVIVSLEASKLRTTYFTGNRHNHHYDLALAYLF
jgi:hypothetical protein